MKPIVLCILDGFGIGDDNDQSNAIAKAQMPNYQHIINNYPNSQLLTSGLAVGLPDGQIGNSEVGHITIGAGRVVYQDLPRINLAIADNSLAQNSDILAFITHLKSNNLPCHIAGLCSDGGVHSHIEHILYLAKIINDNGINLFLHLFCDGRDVAQKSILQYLQYFDGYNIATISGRYYSMDRDNKIDRTSLATKAILQGTVDDSNRFSSASQAVQYYYDRQITDEFILPSVIGNYQGVDAGSGLIFANFRADRARQISHSLAESNKFSKALALTEYSQQLNSFYKVLFPPQQIVNSLPQVLSDYGLKQLRIAETEKYAHVSFFFSCGREQEFVGESRILVQSPAVATYDLMPEMSAKIVGEKLQQAILSQQFDFIVVNYANPDMVGHSGLLEPAVRACEAIDKQLQMLEQAVLAVNGSLLITADHGNVECMQNSAKQPHTAHTTNPVPFILVAKNANNYKLSNGSLQDIAPSILYLMNIAKPPQMTGSNLILPNN
jgi:2,3-bisphosphoglycerate-independent phosphoglycerate mutase